MPVSWDRRDAHPLSLGVKYLAPRPAGLSWPLGIHTPVQ